MPIITTIEIASQSAGNYSTSLVLNIPQRDIRTHSPLNTAVSTARLDHFAGPLVDVLNKIEGYLTTALSCNDELDCRIMLRELGTSIEQARNRSEQRVVETRHS